jgi:hypothetical protein
MSMDIHFVSWSSTTLPTGIVHALAVAVGDLRRDHPDFTLQLRAEPPAVVSCTFEFTDEEMDGTMETLTRFRELLTGHAQVSVMDDLELIGWSEQSGYGPGLPSDAPPPDDLPKDGSVDLEAAVLEPGQASAEADAVDRALHAFINGRGNAVEAAESELHERTLRDGSVLPKLVVAMADAGPKPLVRAGQMLSRLLSGAVNTPELLDAVSALLQSKPKVRVMKELGRQLGAKTGAAWAGRFLQAVGGLAPKAKAAQLLAFVFADPIVNRHSEAASALLPAAVTALQLNRKANVDTRAGILETLAKVDDGRCWPTWLIEACSPPASTESINFYGTVVWWYFVLKQAPALPPAAHVFLLEMAEQPMFRPRMIPILPNGVADRKWLESALGDTDPIVRLAAVMALDRLKPCADRVAAVHAQLATNSLIGDDILDLDYDLNAAVEAFTERAAQGNASTAEAIPPAPSMSELLAHPSPNARNIAIANLVLTGDIEGENATAVVRARNLQYAMNRRFWYDDPLARRFMVQLKEPPNAENAYSVDEHGARSLGDVLRVARMTADSAELPTQVLPAFLEGMPTNNDEPAYDGLAAKLAPQIGPLIDKRLAGLHRLEKAGTTLVEGLALSAERRPLALASLPAAQQERLADSRTVREIAEATGFSWIETVTAKRLDRQALEHAMDQLSR